MFWKKVILLLLIPMMHPALGHLHVDSHAEHHPDHLCAHEAHEHHCHGCNTDLPGKTVPPRETTAPQHASLRLLAAVILLHRAPAPQALQPRPACIQLEYRHKLEWRQRLLSVQLLT